MTNRSRSTVMLFIFFITWASNKLANGGVIKNFTDYLRFAVRLRVSFVTTGLCLYMYLYFLRPVAKVRENWGIGVRVVRCVIFACLLKCKSRSRREKKGWIDSTEGKCDKTTIGKTKQLLFLYAVTLPTVGFIFYIGFDSSILFDEFYDSTKPGWIATTIGPPMKIMFIVSAAISFFGTLPLVKQFAFWRSANNMYLLGSFVSVVSFFYASIAFNDVGTLAYSSTSGLVRMFNTANETVSFHTHDQTVSSSPHQIGSHQATVVSYELDETTLYMVHVRYEKSGNNLSMFLSVTPGTATGYVILDPPKIVRIPGELPIREGPPGTNEFVHPRIYVFNSAETLLRNWFTINVHGQHRVVNKFQLLPRKLTVFNLLAGVYDFAIKEANVETTMEIENGGIYGIIAYSNSTSRSITIDKVKPGNTVSDSVFIPYGIMVGIAFTFAFVGLTAIIYSIAPSGLMGMSFSYISSLEHITMWLVYVGFHTWHHLISADAFFTYAFSMTFLFFISLYIFIKYRNVCDF